MVDIDNGNDIYFTLGAVLIGSIVAVFLSGLVSMQVALYYRTYHDDRAHFKVTVGMIWLMDIAHSVMICIANWLYVIENFGDKGVSNVVVWSVPVTIALTAFITFFVHCFFTHRILSLSKNNWFLAVPIAVIATFRLGFALLTTTKLITMKEFSVFISQFSWSFTMGLALSTAVDILIAASLCWYLNKSRTGFSIMDNIIDSITLYTVENGLLTCVATVVSLVCWLMMPHNLIFLGLHFVISKLYSNTFLATLNARNALRGRSQPHNSLRWPENLTQFSRQEPYSPSSPHPSTTVQVNVEKTIQSNTYEDIEMPGLRRYRSYKR